MRGNRQFSFYLRAKLSKNFTHFTTTGKIRADCGGKAGDLPANLYRIQYVRKSYYLEKMERIMLTVRNDYGAIQPVSAYAWAK